MKKIFCMLLSLLFIFHTGIFLLATAAQENINEISAAEFAAEVCNLIRANETSESLPGRESYRNASQNGFETSRLIVKSSKKISSYGAVSVINGYDDLWVLQYSTPDEAENAFNYYKDLSCVEYVEADKEISVLTNTSGSESALINSDEELTYLSWGPEHIGMDKFNANLTLNNNTPLKEVIVAVIDTGVDPNHPFLEGRILPTRINTSSSGTRNDSMDDNGHGTQVAGVIVDSTLDNIYVQPYKVLDSKGNGTLISVAAGIDCAVNDGVDVINLSLGFEEESETLKEAIDKAEFNDIIIVSSAGNDGTDTRLYPASYDSVIKVTAINASNIVPNFSSYGDDVDFAAPGVSITTTTLNNAYITTRGTSIASPFVSALAATLRAMNSNASAEDIYDIMKENAVQISEFEAELKCGNGIIHAPEGLLPINKEQTSAPYFSHETQFSETELDIEIYCDTPDAVIYYTTNKSYPSKANPSAMIYDGTPIHASQTITVYAVAYCNDMYRSSVSTFATIIAPYLSENSITVDSNGVITSYSGSLKSFTIPEKINGTTVTAIGESVFEGMDVTEVILPDSVTKICKAAFNNCFDLKTIYGKNVTVIEENGFYNCVWLKNILLLADLTSVGKYSFYNVGSKQYSNTGSTFTLNLKSLKNIPEGCFSCSAISTVELGTLLTIGNNAFLECNQLVNVSAEKLYTIPNGCFKGCSSLYSVEIGGLTSISIGAFSSCEKLSSVDFADTKYVYSNAFENCVSLTNVKLPAASTVYSNAFDGCTSLDILYLPAMLTFENVLYTETDYYPLLPENLKTFYAPAMTKTVSNMFKNCPDIENIFLNSATQISENTFNGCNNIYFINIESVETLSENTFSNCSAMFIDARSLVTTADMPDNSGILLSNNFIESTDKATALTVYGTPNTFVERYSKLKGYDFVPIPLIYNELPEYVTENSETVYIFAAGFDITYQWYWNTKPSTEGGTPIDGATTMSYTFTEADKAPYYYCLITQNDLGIISTISTSIIFKDTVPADYTAYNEAVEKAKSIDRSLYSNLAVLDAALAVDVSDLYSCEQGVVDAQTEAIHAAIENLKVKVVKNINLYASETDLRLFESVRIINVLQPTDAIISNEEWVSENTDVVIVSKTGYVRCVGDGTADVKLRIANADGTVTEGVITFNCNLTTFEKIIAFLFKWIFVFAAQISYNI